VRSGVVNADIGDDPAISSSIRSSWRRAYAGARDKGKPGPVPVVGRDAAHKDRPGFVAVRAKAAALAGTCDG
jgi:hypothetical protein